MRVLAIACLLTILSSCQRNQPPTRLRTSHATCESMCDYYEYCKASEQEQRFGVCVSDCRSIFSEDGQMDRGALLAMQRLECPELLSFIEGEDARPLAPKQSSLSKSSSAPEL